MKAKETDKVMSVEEAEQLQRAFILGDASYKMPDGRTKGEFLAEQRKAELEGAAAAAARQTEALRSQAAASPEKVLVRFTNGQMTTHPLAAEVKEEVEGGKSEVASDTKAASKTKAAKK